MEIFVFGVFAGMIAAMILIGVVTIGMGKTESNEHRSDNSDNTSSDGECRSVDRHIKEVEILDLAKRIGVRLGGAK